MQMGACYAEALYALAELESCCRQIGLELEILNKCFRKMPDYLRLLSAMEIPVAERLQVIDEVFGSRAHPYVQNLLKLMTEKGKLRFFFSCCEAYQKLLETHCGNISVHIYTAVALTPSQREKLTQKLESMTGGAIHFIEKIDPNCIGGVRLIYAGKQIDGTVRGQLKALAEALS